MFLKNYSLSRIFSLVQLKNLDQLIIGGAECGLDENDFSLKVVALISQ